TTPPRPGWWPHSRLRPERRSRGAALWLDTRGYSWSRQASLQSGHGSSEARRDPLAELNQRLHRFDRLHEGVAFSRAKVELDDALDALGADHHRYASIETLHVVFAVEVGGARQPALVVFEIGIGHFQRGGGRCVIGRGGLQQATALRAAVTRALNDLVEPLLRDPAHAHEIGKRNASHGRIADER